MKKILILTTLVLMLAVGIVPVSAAQAVYYPSELAYIDAQITVMQPLLDQFQTDYHAVNNRYYQALVSHSSPPNVPQIPDSIYSTPTDQPESLAYFWNYASLPDLLAWSLRIDTYSGPDGDGYVLNVETVINGETWTRSVNVGPDNWRAADWYQIVTE
jgi:hypothetical protein